MRSWSLGTWCLVSAQRGLEGILGELMGTQVGSCCDDGQKILLCPEPVSLLLSNSTLRSHTFLACPVGELRGSPLCP